MAFLSSSKVSSFNRFGAYFRTNYFQGSTLLTRSSSITKALSATSETTTKIFSCAVSTQSRNLQSTKRNDNHNNATFLSTSHFRATSSYPHSSLIFACGASKKKMKELIMEDLRAQSVGFAQKKSTSRLYLDSCKQVMDPYCPPKRIPLPFSTFAFKQYMGAFRNIASNLMCWWRITGLDRSFKYYRGQFAREVKDFYRHFNQAVASGDIEELKDMALDKIFVDLRAKLMNVKHVGDQENRWVENSLSVKPKVLRHIKIEELGLQFAQCTVHIKANHKVEIWKDDKLIGSSPDRTVEEYWVLEKSLTSPNSKWRLLDILPVPDSY